MRKVSIPALIVCLVLGTAVVAMAKETKEAVHTAKGPITAVNTAGNSFSVKEKTGDETFMVTGSTKIEEHGKTVKLVDLKSGEEVSVWYTTNAGNNEASKVIVHTMKAKPAKSGARR
ncbi:MAG TPA: DUF5666 domain-containing protein [Thermoanaerobaculia bacterium]|jgi:hypothetical protein